MKSTGKVAILYQAAPAPARDGSIKPMKAGGYADSGADIANSLIKQHVDVVTPSFSPDALVDLDWVFPDTREGISRALERGATIFWLNTVLYADHPISEFMNDGIRIVGQNPADVEKYDDKFSTNQLLYSHGLPVPRAVMIMKNEDPRTADLSYPLVAKPVRGRGSMGVRLLDNAVALGDYLEEVFQSGAFGNAMYAEEYLPGEELTITVLPPGHYTGADQMDTDRHWALPPVRRFNHVNGVAPYSGKVAVINNSRVLEAGELRRPVIRELCTACERAAEIVDARAPVRVDCRADARGRFMLFDLNMKPNMTGASRPHRADQDSLMALAARKINWNYDKLVMNMLMQVREMS